MPLFKGSGCKSYAGKAINYITDKNKAEIVSSQNLNDNQSYSKQFLDTAHLYGKGDKFDERKYYHFKLSCDRADNVSAKAHHEYAEEIARKLFPDYECVIATHTDTETVHSHIIVNAVSFENGHKFHCNNKEYTAMKDMANEIGLERGFSYTDFRQPSQTNDRVTSKETIVNLKGGTSWKEELREVIAEAKANSSNMIEFEKHLNSYGVKLTRNTDKTIAYLHPQKEKAIRGEKLGLDYTKGAILNVINQQRGEYTNTKRENERTEQGKQNGVSDWVAGGNLDGISGAINDVEKRVERYSARNIQSATTDKQNSKQPAKPERDIGQKYRDRGR